MDKATFGAGCFWGVQKEFDKIKGVISTTVGYMGGTTKNPSYEDVCTNKTGHVEVLDLIFDPEIISFEKLIEIFFNIHNPTTKDRQGPDIGTQYKSIIFYHNDKQKKTAEDFIKKLDKSGKYKRKIVTEIKPADVFYKAEEYHQKYFEKK